MSRSYLFVHSRYVRLGTPFLQGVWRRSNWQWNSHLVVNARYESSDIEALQHEKKLMKVDINHKKNDESMLNYYIAMDYKSKDKIKNYVHYLEKSADAENIYPESALELANHNKDNADIISKIIRKG